jgi:FkbM family methyltransferase
MKMRTGLTIQNIPKLPLYVWYMVKALFLFHKPLRIILHYLRESAPVDRTVALKNGLIMFLSEHPHDIVTIFVVMVKREYGAVRPGSIVVDIGANIGSFSLYAAKQGARKIYAYEPNEQSNAVFARNITQNSYSTVIESNRAAVLGEVVSSAVMPKQASPYNQIRAKDIVSENEEEVPSVTLEKIVIDNRIDVIDLLKIDCEGAEYGILYGAPAAILGKIREIRMEYHSGDQEVDKLTAYLQTHGFRIVSMKRSDRILWLNRA